jgi:hypothetical protein
MLFQFICFIERLDQVSPQDMARANRLGQFHDGWRVQRHAAAPRACLKFTGTLAWLWHLLHDWLGDRDRRCDDARTSLGREPHKLNLADCAPLMLHWRKWHRLPTIVLQKEHIACPRGRHHVNLLACDIKLAHRRTLLHQHLRVRTIRIHRSRHFQDVFSRLWVHVYAPSEFFNFSHYKSLDILNGNNYYSK